jgi:hypothetical protein
MRNLPLFVLCCVTSVAIEVYAAGGIFQQTTASVSIMGRVVPLAPVEATISLSCGLLAIWASMAASKAKNDLRREQRDRAFGIRILSLALLFTPIYYAGNSFAFQKQLGEWQQYHGSAQEAADQRQAQDRTLDSMAQRDAAVALRKSQRPIRAEFDIACMFWAAFLYGLNALAAGVCWIAKPETASEARRRADSERAQRAAKTRERNRKEAERMARQGQGGRFSVLTGGRI